MNSLPGLARTCWVTLTSRVPCVPQFLHAHGEELEQEGPQPGHAAMPGSVRAPAPLLPASDPRVSILAHWINTCLH